MRVWEVKVVTIGRLTPRALSLREVLNGGAQLQLVKQLALAQNALVLQDCCRIGQQNDHTVCKGFSLMVTDCLAEHLPRLSLDLQIEFLGMKLRQRGPYAKERGWYIHCL